MAQALIGKAMTHCGLECLGATEVGDLNDDLSKALIVDEVRKAQQAAAAKSAPAPAPAAQPQAPAGSGTAGTLLLGGLVAVVAACAYGLDRWSKRK